MSYIGYIAEELMHGREQETRRLASGYRQRHAAKEGRGVTGRGRAARARGNLRTEAAPC